MNVVVKSGVVVGGREVMKKGFDAGEHDGQGHGGVERK